MTTTQTPPSGASDAAVAQAFNEYLDINTGNKSVGTVMTEIWERAKALTAEEVVTGIGDVQLLRALCEDVPDMHHSVRTQLELLASKIESGAKIGMTRCRRCGEKAEVTIHEMSLTSKADGGEPAWDIVAHDGKAYSPAEQDAMRATPPAQVAGSGMGDVSETVMSLFCNAIDNLGDYPISEEWAAKWVMKADEALAAQPAPVVGGEVGKFIDRAVNSANAKRDRYERLSDALQNSYSERDAGSRQSYADAAQDFGKFAYWLRDHSQHLHALSARPAVEGDEAPFLWAWNQGGQEVRYTAPDEFNAWKWTPLYTRVASPPATTNGPSAYCEPCQSVGMSNCGSFDECGNARCITCKQYLDPRPAPSAVEGAQGARGGEVSDDQLLAALRKAGVSGEVWREATFTRYKDGIYIDYPRLWVRNFIRIIQDLTPPPATGSGGEVKP